MDTNEQIWRYQMKIKATNECEDGESSDAEWFDAALESMR